MSSCNHKCLQSDLCPARTGKRFKDGTGCVAFPLVTGCSQKVPIAQSTRSQAAIKTVADDDTKAARGTERLLVAGVWLISILSGCILLAKAAGLI